MAETQSVLRQTDDESRRLARKLLRGASFVSLAVCDQQSGFPAVSRALTATDYDGVPVILISSLAAHTKSLLADQRCSLLAGEPGKGDPLAHARITVFAQAHAVDRDSEAHGSIRRRFLNRHPKSALYIDFPDFAFFRLMPMYASLNGGFGRAFALESQDLLTPAGSSASDWLRLEEEIMSTNQDATQLARTLGYAITKKCHLTGVDSSGIDFATGSVSFRYEFKSQQPDPQSVIDEISRILDIV
ncbi:pyridoxamine 5'-phosphate oxidase family protein [Rhizobium sp. FY34]|uniref:HugZ family pyridoxamine 5'-phosphate oxidase n=1 Tax=Rhizobium sp. FY34 TaxID=2562309 RepID=UPI0010BFCDFF|nr:pyridoxamine 5'-phosphate oxidase family protein [Rhizobium sp. FY34]